MISYQSLILIATAINNKLDAETKVTDLETQGPEVLAPCAKLGYY